MRRIAPAIPALLEVMVVGYEPETNSWVVVEKGSMVSKDTSLVVNNKHLKLGAELEPEGDATELDHTNG